MFDKKNIYILNDYHSIIFVNKYNVITIKYTNTQTSKSFQGPHE